MLTITALCAIAIQNPPLWNINRHFSDQTFSQERVQPSWTTMPWTSPDTVWIKRLALLRAQLAKGQGSTLLDSAWKNAGQDPITPEKAFDLAFALIEVLPKKEHPAWQPAEFMRLVPSRRAFILAPMVASYQYARMRFLVEARVETRGEVVATYAPLVKRLLARQAPDRAVSISGSYVLAHSSRSADIDFAFSLADSLIRVQPKDFWANSNRASALLFKWYRTKKEPDRIAASNALVNVRELAKEQGRDTSIIDECLRILRK